jgi:hypothetical protein
MHQNAKLKSNAIYLYFCEFSCFCSRVVTDSVLGYDIESLGNQLSGSGKESPAYEALVIDYSLIQYHCWRRMESSAFLVFRM